MNNKNLEELKEAYSNVYNSSEMNDEVEYLDEMGRTRTTGQNSGMAFKPSDYRSAGSAGGSGSGGRRGTRPSFKPTASSRPKIGSLPPSAKQVSQYPAGVPTGVGGGNAGSSTSRGTTKVGSGSLSGGGSPRPATPAPSATKVGGGSLSGAKVVPTAAVKQTGDKTKDMQTCAKANPTLANKPQRTFNPLMQKTFGYQTGYSPSEVKGNMQKTKTLAGAGVLSNSSKRDAKTMKDIYSLYNSVYEAKKVDQDKDGDNDFADVRIARMIASGVPKHVAIAKVKNKPYNEEVEIEEATLSAKAARAGKDIGKPGKQFAKIAASAAERYGSKERGEKVAGAILKKMRAKAHEEFELDEATRMRKELGKEGEIATRKELASRSKAHKRSGSVDKTIAAAERAADWSRDEKKSKALRGLASSRRKSVRGESGLRGYAAKVEGSDKELQSARGSARSAGTLTPKEKKQLGEAYDIVSSYLLENNFAETIEDANVIIENMSASWVGEILDQYEASIQEDFQNWIQALLDEGYDLSEYSVEELSEIYYQQD